MPVSVDGWTAINVCVMGGLLTSRLGDGEVGAFELQIRSVTFVGQSHDCDLEGTDRSRYDVSPVPSRAYREQPRSEKRMQINHLSQYDVTGLLNSSIAQTRPTSALAVRLWTRQQL
jgi:hypothetical protein